MEEETHRAVMSVGVVLGLGEILVNLFAVLTIVRNRYLWSPSTIYIASLAVSDMVTGVLLVLLGLNALPAYTQAVFTHPPVCLGLLLLTCTSTLASILTFAVVSVDRFLSIARPFQYNQRATNRAVITVVLAVWGLALGQGAVIIYFKAVSRIPACVWNYPVQSELYVLCGTVYVCVALSGVMYVLLSRIALRHLRAIASQTLAPAHALEQSLRPCRETFRQKLRAFKMFVVVLGSFCLFWGPYLGAVPVHHLVRPLSAAVLDFTFLLGMGNSLGNVFIYMVFNADFRVAYKLFFRRT
ncbi:5-hydroxytryptamine receptor 1D-like [Babylonia areolata]|uniref:5-hydroxytryptamine receptor 1D-like n=1 Tax=Babylonia areolata TaxID=304850 RepID=UPI003FD2EEC8